VIAAANPFGPEPTTIASYVLLKVVYLNILKSFHSLVPFGNRESAIGNGR
jgi:hypothetical protein